MYATISDLIERFGSDEILTLAPNEQNNDINANRLNVVIADTEAEINSYLAVRYRVPIAGAEQLKAVTCDIARYRLYDNQASDEVTNRYNQRISWLKDVSAGRATLGIAESDAGGTLHCATTTRAADRLFTRESMGTY